MRKKSTVRKKKTGPVYRSPEYMAQLGRRGGKAAAKNGVLSENAALSHKKNNPQAKRRGYNGGRRPQEVNGTLPNAG